MPVFQLTKGKFAKAESHGVILEELASRLLYVFLFHFKIKYKYKYASNSVSPLGLGVSQHAIYNQDLFVILSIAQLTLLLLTSDYKGQYDKKT